MRVRAEDEERDRAQALDAANRCGPALRDPFAWAPVIAAVAVGLVMVLALVFR